jgi:hypothetical protein
MGSLMPSAADSADRPPEADKPRAAFDGRLLLWIAAGVGAWGVFHAIGAYRLNHNPWRAVVVLACMAAFLVGWWLLLRRRSRPPAKGRAPNKPTGVTSP